MIKCASTLESNGIPLLSKQKLENYGEQILLDYSPPVLLTPQPTNIDGLITEYMDFNFEYQYLSNNCVHLGITVFNDTNTLPVYNPALNQAEFISVKKNTILIEGTLAENTALEHRERFTEGHEASHGLLHPEYYRHKAEYARFCVNKGETFLKSRIDQLTYDWKQNIFPE